MWPLMISGGWTVVSGNPLGSVESFLHSASLMMNATHGGTKSAHMDLQFYLFQQELTLTTDGASFTISPRYTKFSLNISSWPWLSHNNTLEIRFSLSPKFANFIKQQDVSTTTFVILGQFANSEAQSHIQLIESVELDGVTHPTGAQFLLDAKSSELVLIFPYFNSSLSYDPSALPTIPLTQCIGNFEKTHNHHFSTQQTWGFCLAPAEAANCLSL